MALTSSILVVSTLLLGPALLAPSLGYADDSLPGTTAESPAVPSVRITSSFDVKYAAAVLRQVAKLMHAGFVRRDAEQVARDIEQMPADQSRHWDFLTTYKHVDYPLQIRARLDDFGMLDLDFFCAPAVAGAVRSAVDGYLNSRGL
jgi:hypothetical protein